MTRRRLRTAALVAVGALALSACANNDAKESDVVNAMEDAGLSTSQAECIGAAVDDAFADDQDLYNDIAAAADSDDFADTDQFPEGTADTIDGILADCIEGEGPAAGDEPDTGDTTETTAETGG